MYRALYSTTAENTLDQDVQLTDRFIELLQSHATNYIAWDLGKLALCDHVNAFPKHYWSIKSWRCWRRRCSLFIYIIIVHTLKSAVQYYIYTFRRRWFVGRCC